MQYYMFHKPQGCVTASRDARQKTVMDYFPPEIRESCFPVGRLDKDTEGFLLITDDGHLCCQLMMPDHHAPKTYYYWAIGTVHEENLENLRRGVLLDGSYLTRPAEAELLERRELGDILEFLPEKERKRAGKHLHTPVFSGTLTITEGKKHQVKRMLREQHAHVCYLKRLSIRGLTLDETLPAGSYRALTAEEVAILYGDEIPPDGRVPEEE